MATSTLSNLTVICLDNGSYGAKVNQLTLNFKGYKVGGEIPIKAWEPVGLEADLLRRRQSGPYPAAFSLHSTTMRLKTDRICPRSPTRLTTIAQVRQAPRYQRSIQETNKPNIYCS